MASQSISFRPAKVVKQLPWSLDRKAALGFLLILVTFSLVGWLYLGQASVITSSTMKIDSLRQEIDLLNHQNSELTLEIAELESITRVEARARELGFAPTNPANIRYLSVPNTLASAPELFASSAQGQTPESSPWQVWLDVLAAKIVGE
jgi:cell division protein FtsL